MMGWGASDDADWGEKPFERVKLRADVAEVLEQYNRVMSLGEAAEVAGRIDLEAARRRGVRRRADAAARAAAVEMLRDGVLG